MTDDKHAIGFSEYHDQNPRKMVPDEFDDFVAYALKRYREAGSKVVNMCHCEDDEELVDEVESYIGDSMEAILLFREWEASR